MNDQDLRTALHETAADIAPRADVVSRARQGGRRRLYRRRGMLAGGVAAVAALAVAGVLTTQPATRPAPARPPTTIDDLTSGPTRGDLAGDRAAVAAALAAYRANTHRKSGHLAWIGHTRYGDVAVTAQHLSHPTRVPVSVFTRTGNGPFRIASAEVTDPGVAGLAEPVFDNRAVFVLDLGAPAYYSTRHTYTADATRRVWHRVRFAHGYAMLPVPAGGSMVVARTDRPRAGDVYSGQPMSSPDVTDHTLRWGPKPVPGGATGPVVAIPATPDAGSLSWARHGGAAKIFTQAMKAGPYNDPFAYWAPVPPWVVYGQTPDGQRFAVGEVQYDSEPSHIYALIGHTVHYVGVSDRTATLPVRVALPGGGWVVAAKGETLAYGDDTGWHDAGRDAALIPAGAAQVRVGSATVPLG